MNKLLIGGYDTKFASDRIYDFNGERILADGRKAPCEIMETLAIYMTAPWEKNKVFKFFNQEDGSIYCECVVEQASFEAFVCGYGNNEEEALSDCILRLKDIESEYIFS